MARYANDPATRQSNGSIARSRTKLVLRAADGDGREAVAELSRRNSEPVGEHSAAMLESSESLNRLTRALVWLTVVLALR